MARIAGVDIPRDKRAEIALTYIYGIGRSTAQKILDKLGVSRDEKMKDLTDDEIQRIRLHIEQNYKVEGSLRTEIQLNIKRLMEIGCYRGIRHKRRLPVRGQRTKTNANMRKNGGRGNRIKRKK